MKRIAILLFAVVVVFAGCESDSKSSDNGLTPVLDANGQAVTNAAGEPLFTDEAGNTGTEAELATANTSNSGSEPATQTSGDTTGIGDNSDDSNNIDLGDSGNGNTGGDDSAGGSQVDPDIIY